MESLTVALALSVFLKILLAGCTGLIAARKFGLRIPAALVVAILFQSCSPFVLLSVWPVSDVVVWLPLFLVFVDRINQGIYRVWPIGAAIMALMLLGGDPESCITVFAFGMLYAIVEGVLCGRAQLNATIRRPAILFAVGLLSALVCSIQLYPFLEYVRQAGHTSTTSEYNQPGIRHAIALLYPYFFGRPPLAFAEQEGGMSFLALSNLYLGVVPILSLPLWIAIRGLMSPLQTRRIDALLLVAAIMTLAGLILPHVLPRIPSILELSAYHFFVSNAFVVGLAIALAGEEWLALDPDECKIAIQKLAFTWLGLACAGLVLVVTSYGAYRPGAPSLLVQLGTSMPWALGLLVLLALTLLRPSERFMAIGLVALIVSDLWLTFGAAARFSPASSLFPESTFVKLLEDRDTRVSGRTALGEWPLAGNFVPQMFGTSGANLGRFQAFISRLDEEPLLLRRSGSPVLLLGKEDIQGSFAKARPVIRLDRVLESGAILFSDLETQSRVRLAYEGRPVGEFDPSQLSADQPPLLETPQPFTATQGNDGIAVLQRDETHTEIAVKIQQAKPGILILADAWYPGWTATIDGQTAEVFPVDGAFRGVLVDTGNHDVVFTYESASINRGKWMSLVGMLVLLGGIVRTVLPRFRKAPAK